MRISYLLSGLLLLAALVAACASQPDAHTCTSGILCPAPLQCAAVQPVCITNSCGNGVLDPGEICDDGNIMDGDGCSHDCLSMEGCGNNTKDPGEDCDDGNTHDGKCDDGSPCNAGDTCPTGTCHADGCSRDCKSQGCGNGRPDPGEACDDSNAADGKCPDGTPCNKNSACAVGTCTPDGCSADCQSKETCNNGIVDLGETCDDGDAAGGPCEADCQSGQGCGNGIIDSGEECDDGNQTDNDDCHNNCKIDVCGDHIQNMMGGHHEDCDPGTGGVPLETATCNIDCTVASCGDGKINHHFKPDGADGEQCDLGSTSGVNNNANDKSCTASCLINVCGDGHQLTGVEDCDTGTSNGTSPTPGTCDSSCHLVACGNGIVDPGEQCDPRTSFTDPANPIDVPGCDSDCTASYCGDLHVNAADHEVCDQGPDNGTPCTYSTTPNTTCVRCAVDCKSVDNARPAPFCGDGNTDAGNEICDQGALDGTPCPYATTCNRCSSDCQTLTSQNGPSCGDGMIETADNEQCDGTVLGGATCVSLGFGGGTLTCSACRFNTTACAPVCGNGIVEQGEQCDGNNHLNGGSCLGLGYTSGNLKCDSSCRYDTSTCGGSCGNDLAEAGEECDGTDLNGASCTSLGFGGGTLSCSGNCHFVTNACASVCGNGRAEAGEQCDGNDLDGASCQTLGYSSGALDCDGSCNYDVSGCHAHCGNDIAETGEQCDGTDLNGATCVTLGYSSGSLKCTACAFETSPCVP